MGLIPGQSTKTLYAVRYGQRNKKKERKKDFGNNIKHMKIHIMEVPGKEEKKGTGLI